MEEKEGEREREEREKQRARISEYVYSADSLLLTHLS